MGHAHAVHQWVPRARTWNVGHRLPLGSGERRNFLPTGHLPFPHVHESLQEGRERQRGSSGRPCCRHHLLREGGRTPWTNSTDEVQRRVATDHRPTTRDRGHPKGAQARGTVHRTLGVRLERDVQGRDLPGSAVPVGVDDQCLGAEGDGDACTVQGSVAEYDVLRAGARLRRQGRTTGEMVGPFVGTDPDWKDDDGNPGGERSVQRDVHLSRAWLRSRHRDGPVRSRWCSAFGEDVLDHPEPLLPGHDAGGSAGQHPGAHLRRHHAQCQDRGQVRHQVPHRIRQRGHPPDDHGR